MAFSANCVYKDKISIISIHAIGFIIVDIVIKYLLCINITEIQPNDDAIDGVKIMTMNHRVGAMC